MSTQRHDMLPTADAETTESMQTSGTTAAFISSSAADAVTSRHRVRFDGAEWASVINDTREQLRKAFVADVEIALGVSTDAVQSVILHRNSPIVEFKLIHSPCLDRHEIDRCLSAFEFSRTWTEYLHFAATESFVSVDDERLDTASVAVSVEAAPARELSHRVSDPQAYSRDDLHEEDAALDRRVGMLVEPLIGLLVTKHRVRLEGDAWEAILQQWRELLMREFISDVCDATSLLPASVQRLVLSAGSLTADFQLSHEGISAGELNQLLANAPFTRTWALYQRFLATESFVSVDDERLDTASVAVSVEAAPSCELSHRVSDPQASSRDDLHEEDAAMDRRVGMLVEPPIRLLVTKHRVRLEGDAWEAILHQWRELLMREFISDVCDATSLLPASVQRLVLSAGSLTADFQLSHEGISAGELNQLLANAPFTRTWALYQRFLEQEGLLLGRAATPAALQATESFVSVDDERLDTAYSRDDLAGAEATMLHQHEEDAALDRRVGMLVEPLIGLLVTKHRVRLEGDAWEAILQQWRELLMREFTSDVCDATSLLPASVQRLVLSAGSLTADFQLSHEGISAGELNQLLANAPFTRTWALYQRFLEQEGLLLGRAATPAALQATESFVSVDDERLDTAYSRDDLAGAEATMLHQHEEDAALDRRVGMLVEPLIGLLVTKHRVRLEGDAWEAILQQWRELLMREFTSDVCDATSLLPASVQRLVLSAGSLTADFQLSHEGISAGELNQLLANAPFTRTWALYQRFLEQEGLLLGRAATPAALQATESFVSVDDERLDTAYSRDDLAGAEATMLHQHEEDAALDRRVGMLVEPLIGLLVTKHRVRLEGDAWEAILQQWRELLMREFTSDVCDATSLLPASVQRLVLSAGSLTADFQLSHEGISAGELDQLLANAPFTRTWALYQRFLEQEGLLLGRAATPAALQATESFVSLEVEEQPPAPVRIGTPEAAMLHQHEEDAAMDRRVGMLVEPLIGVLVTKHRVRLEGDAWEAILQQWRELLMREFISDVCDATSLLPASVQRLVLSAGSLTADFQLSHEGISAGELDQLLANAPFTRTWALYHRFLEQEGLLLGRAATPTALQATESFVSLGVEEQPPAPVRIGTPEEATMLHQHEEDAALDRRVGMLVEPLIGLLVTKHRVRLEGDGWEAILQQWRELLMREFTSDVCDATSLLPASVQRLVLSAGSLTADFQLSHEGISAGELDQLLANAPFTRTWALYHRFLEQEGLLLGRAATPTALQATESFVSLGVEEQPPAPVRIGTPEEVLPAVQRATPPPTALQATESFVSLGVEEQPPAPVRIGTPEEVLPAVQRATPPPTALQATESFVSVDDEWLDTASVAVSVEAAPSCELSHRVSDPQAYSRDDLAGAEAAMLHQHEEDAAMDRRVGMLVEPLIGLLVTKHRVRLEGDSWEAILQQWRELLMREFISDVCDATSLLPASVQRLVLSAGSLTADFQLSHEGISAGELDQLLANAPFTRTWALYHCFLEQEGLLLGRAATPTALQATESFVSLGVEEQPPAPVRIGTPEEVLPAVQRATPPPTALQATESFVSLGVEEQPPAPVRIGTPEEVLPAVQRATPPPTALQATESFVSLGVEEQPPAPVRIGTPEEVLPAVQRATPPPTALQATESFVSLGVEEQPPAPVRIGTPEEVLPAVQRATPPPTALQATESFVSLGVEEQPPAPVRIGTPEEVLPAVQRATPPPTALQATESFVSLGVEEQPPAPVRIGTPEEVLPAVQRATPPPNALQATESFVSVDDERLDTASVAVSVEAAAARELSHRVSDPQAYSRDDLAGAEATMLHQHEEDAAMDRRVGMLVEPLIGLLVTKHRVRLEGDSWEAILQQWRELLMREFISDVCDATSLLPASVQRLVLSAGSLTADFQLSHVGISAGELDQLLANAPFTRTWALYHRFLEQEGLLLGRAATPAALQATESFVSLGVEEQPPAPVRIGTPEEVLPAVQRATPPPTALQATESFVSLGVEEQPPAPVRIGTPEEVLPAVQRAKPPPNALQAPESFVSVDDEWLDTASVAVSVEAAPSCELSHRVSDPQAYSRDDLAGAEAAMLHQHEEDAAMDRRVGMLVEPLIGLLVTKHRVRLEGDSWEAILQQWRAADARVHQRCLRCHVAAASVGSKAGAFGGQPHRRLPAVARRHISRRAESAACQRALHSHMGPVPALP
ncbi:hypothetical protein LSCM4_02637 [Leishmania orientalis]|uniref:Flagellar attachment zone protein 1 conserved domain-containing protein n=1 Tax=Leishmania orientalis TaxID=2249476 RepID=A0A836GBV0_9TRYP|nr:hypothetical protein LSCM4_02637 [Leishmania orientalis]